VITIYQIKLIKSSVDYKNVNVKVNWPFLYQKDNIDDSDDYGRNVQSVWGIVIH